MIKKLILTAILATGLGSAAMANEGHWSIGGGVQCHIGLGGVIVCSKSRP